MVAVVVAEGGNCLLGLKVWWEPGYGGWGGERIWVGNWDEWNGGGVVMRGSDREDIAILKGREGPN